MGASFAQSTILDPINELTAATIGRLGEISIAQTARLRARDSPVRQLRVSYRMPQLWPRRRLPWRLRPGPRPRLRSPRLLRLHRRPKLLQRRPHPLYRRPTRLHRRSKVLQWRPSHLYQRPKRLRRRLSRLRLRPVRRQKIRRFLRCRREASPLPASRMWRSPWRRTRRLGRRPSAAAHNPGLSPPQLRTVCTRRKLEPHSAGQSAHARPD